MSKQFYSPRFKANIFFSNLLESYFTVQYITEFWMCCWGWWGLVCVWENTTWLVKQTVPWATFLFDALALLETTPLRNLWSILDSNWKTERSTRTTLHLFACGPELKNQVHFPFFLFFGLGEAMPLGTVAKVCEYGHLTRQFKLLFLSLSLSLLEYVNPVCLPTPDRLTTKNGFLFGLNLTVAGWGMTRTSKYLQLPLTSR
jgi:hypothetical protein